MSFVEAPADAVAEPQRRIAELERRIAKLEKINAALMDGVERSVDNRANAFSLFQTTIGLERQVRLRTDELRRTLRRLELTNDQLLLAKEMADQANSSKTRFLAHAGHDLLQPLNAARLSLSALTEIQSGEAERRLTRQVERALSTIENLLKTLLDISRLDAGVMVPELTEVALGDLFADLAADFNAQAKRRGLDYKVVPTSVHVESDPMMLNRILQNLVGNALRYTERGGVRVGVRQRQHTVRIDVVDTGPGIPEHQHALIFEEFHRGRSHSAEGEVGLGLGLSIVQRLVGVLGHDISLRSKVGKGTTFSIELKRVAPTLRSPEVKPEIRPAEGWGLQGAFVAVIDNDPAVRESTAELIRRWYGEAVPASSGEELALRFSTLDRSPDLLLVDYHLDDGTGLDAIRTVRDIFGDTIPAIIVTADYSDETEDRVTRAGIELLRKPVKPAELRALLAHLLA